MTAVTVTAADVRPLPGAVIMRYRAGGTVAVGDAVYIAADGDVEKADADDTAQSKAIGIAVSAPNGAASAAAGDYVDVAVFGPVAGFSGMTPGTRLFSSTTAGAIEDAAPAGASGDFAWEIGYAASAAVVFVQPSTFDVAAQ